MSCSTPSFLRWTIFQLSLIHILERLTVSGLTRRYVGGRGIEDIDLCLQAGTLTLVTGRVGAGKTTLLRTILGLIKPDAGAILWNDRVLEAETCLLYTSRCV